MKLVGSAGQQARHPLYDASGTITSGGTAQLVLAQRISCSFLKLQNLSNGPLWFEFGSARAHATVSGGKVTAVTVDNAGFNFTYPPIIEFLGGGNWGNPTFIGVGQPGYQAGSPPAKATAAMTTSAIAGNKVSSITVDNPGANYIVAPYVHIYNSPLDPGGVAIPAVASGMLLAAGSPPYILNGTACTTDPISVYGATTGQQFLAKWMD